MFYKILIFSWVGIVALEASYQQDKVEDIMEITDLELNPKHGRWRGVFHTKAGPIIHTPQYYQIGLDNKNRKKGTWFYKEKFHGIPLKEPLLLSVNIRPGFFMEQLIEAGLLLEGHLPVGKREVIPKAILPFSSSPTQLRRRIPRDSD
jgi:hypothetical protein